MDLKISSLPSDISILLLRVGLSALMLHHGLEKLEDPVGFSEFVVGKYFGFLPFGPLFWTYVAAFTQLLCPIGLALGIVTRPCALGLGMTMLFALVFHGMDTGLEGFPLTVVADHNYAFEMAAVYFMCFMYFLCSGPGRLSLYTLVMKKEPSREITLGIDTLL